VYIIYFFPHSFGDEEEEEEEGRRGRRKRRRGRVRRPPWRVFLFRIDSWLLSAASLPLRASIKRQTVSFRPAGCLEPGSSNSTEEWLHSASCLRSPSLQLGAIIHLLCVSGMEKKKEKKSNGPPHHWRGSGRQLYGVARS
jgi:hypothetical protein